MHVRLRKGFSLICSLCQGCWTKRRCTRSRNISIWNVGLNFLYSSINSFIVSSALNSNERQRRHPPSSNWRTIHCTEQFINCSSFCTNAMQESHSHPMRIGSSGTKKNTCRETSIILADLNREVKSSSSFMSDLERDDSCALYLLEQIPHILTFKDVRMINRSEKRERASH